MPFWLSTGPDAPPLDREQISEIYDRTHEMMSYVARKCEGLTDQALWACEDKYRDRFHMWERIQSWASTAIWFVLILVLVVLAYHYRKQIENAVIDGIAGAIRGKRRMASHMSDVSERIKQKADE
ncbi:hypothetical protein ACHMW7_29740 [Aminobacter sp. UC22_36]|uniref:hypothetical protein n=1 Tax=Aminobacter sp. UC22_36 TaxID=3374549 RepID=UPI0037573F96